MRGVNPINHLWWRNAKIMNNEVWNSDSANTEVTNCQTEKHVVRRGAKSTTSVKQDKHESISQNYYYGNWKKFTQGLESIVGVLFRKLWGCIAVIHDLLRWTTWDDENTEREQKCKNETMLEKGILLRIMWVTRDSDYLEYKNWDWKKISTNVSGNFVSEIN